MLTIRCARCRKKIFKYRKIGKGRLLHCWKEHIIKDFSMREGRRVLCECRNLIGIDRGNRIQMRQRAFTSSGTKTSK